MLVTQFYKGQGLGNQLWCYAVIRSLASRRKLNFGIQSPENFKGKNIFDLDFGEKVIGGFGPEGGPPVSLPDQIQFYLRENASYHSRYPFEMTRADQKLLEINDGTKFDGNCQSLKYLPEDLLDLRQYFKIRDDMTVNNAEDMCVIHVRGGDFLSTYSFLPKSYYEKAISAVKQFSKTEKFVIVTDDIKYCNKILPSIPIVGSTPKNEPNTDRASHHMGGDISVDFRLLYNAKNIILSSSTFSFWPALLNPNSPLVIAPKYWFAYNKSNGWWSPHESIIPFWKYMDKDGNIFDGKECIEAAIELRSYRKILKQSNAHRIWMRIHKHLRYI